MKTQNQFLNTSFTASIILLAVLLVSSTPKAEAQYFSGGEAPKANGFATYQHPKYAAATPTPAPASLPTPTPTPTYQQPVQANATLVSGGSYQTSVINVGHPLEPVGYSRVHTENDVPNHYHYSEINGQVRSESVQRSEYSSRETTERPTIIGERDTAIYRTVYVTTNITSSSYVPYYGTPVDVKFAKDAPQASHVEGGGPIAHAIVNMAIRSVTPQKNQNR